jgi:hypothetical protein
MRTALAFLLLCGTASASEWNPFADAEPVSAVPAFTMRPGFGLALYTAASCVHCGPAKANAARSGVPVELIDADAFPGRVSSVPTWVLTQDGREVKRWTGPGSRAGVREMAAWEPPQRIEARGVEVPAGPVAFPGPAGFPIPAVEPGAVVTHVNGVPVTAPQTAPYVEKQRPNVVRRAAPVTSRGMHSHTCRNCRATFSHPHGSPAADHYCRNCRSTNLTGVGRR